MADINGTLVRYCVYNYGDYESSGVPLAGDYLTNCVNMANPEYAAYAAEITDTVLNGCN